MDNVRTIKHGDYQININYGESYFDTYYMNDLVAIANNDHYTNETYNFLENSLEFDLDYKNKFEQAIQIAFRAACRDTAFRKMLINDEVNYPNYLPANIDNKIEAIYDDIQETYGDDYYVLKYPEVMKKLQRYWYVDFTPIILCSSYGLQPMMGNQEFNHSDSNVWLIQAIMKKEATKPIKGCKTVKERQRHFEAFCYKQVTSLCSDANGENIYEVDIYKIDENNQSTHIDGMGGVYIINTDDDKEILTLLNDFDLSAIPENMRTFGLDK